MKELEELQRVSEKIAEQLAEFNRVCAALKWNPQATPELHNGYTMEQWRQMVEGPWKGIPFVCEFGRFNESASRIGVLLRVSLTDFIDTSLSGYDNCRVITRPGHWVPWFGGDCPVGANAVVVTVLRGGDTRLSRSGAYSWSHDNTASDIIAYMVAPEVSK